MLTQLLKDLGGQEMLYRLLLFILTGQVGMISHYAKQWTRGEIAGSLTQYLFKDQPRKTVAAASGVVGTGVSLFMAGQLAPDALSLFNLLTVGFASGYTANSLLNKGAPGPVEVKRVAAENVEKELIKKMGDEA